jgi:hypothetical protein
MDYGKRRCGYRILAGGSKGRRIFRGIIIIM